MEILGWIGWLVAAILAWVWSIAWLLLGGWVSTLLQLVVLAFVLFALKYGWRRAPLEMATRLKPAASWLWRWARTRDGGSSASETGGRAGTVRTEVRLIRVKAPGDVNLSSLLNVMMLTGIAMLRLL